ncbi:MAG: hypothetical protein C5S38_06375 [Candidatus Methanophagaceae archaeon]|nr:MAG: hypothetical protein C5S38_06375 [Methanophagales archaeon]
MAVLFFPAVTAVVSAAPNCSVVVTPDDLLANSTGTFTAIINCTDDTGINISSFLMTNTVEGGVNPGGPPNWWSIRPPANNWTQSSAPITEQILRSYNRGEGKWFDFAGIFGDNFSYGVHDKDSLHVEITNGTTWAKLNYTWVVETTAFRNMFFLARSALEAEDKANKKEYRVYADNPLLVKFWDMEQMRGTSNYTVCGFGNINYTGSPSPPLEMYYCNSSYRTESVELPNYGASDATANMTGNVLLMHLNETVSGSTIVDYSGEGHNGTISGASVNNFGKFNKSVYFSSLDTDDVNIPDTDVFGITDKMTVSAWIYPTTINDYGRIIAKAWETNMPPWVVFGLTFDGSTHQNRAWFMISTNGGSYNLTPSTTVIPTSAWTHVVGTYDGSNISIYINGVKENSTSTTGNIDTNSQPVLIGRNQHPVAQTQSFEGYIDEVAIWNRSLNATEIKDLYTRAVLKPVDSPFCVWGDSVNTTELGSIEYTSRNSSYAKIRFGVSNSKIGGIDTTDTCYYYYGSEATSGNEYLIRYANGSSGTNVSFADSNVAWSSANDVVNWTQTQFTPDVWYATIKEGDLFQLGVYVENNTGAKYTNFTLYEDEIGDVNWNISDPRIAYYQSASSGKDYDLNGTYSGNMTIRVEMAKDPDGPGTVTHNLTLRHPDGSWYYTINDSFKSSDDSDVDIVFDTKNVLNGHNRKIK